MGQSVATEYEGDSKQLNQKPKFLLESPVELRAYIGKLK